MANVVSDEVYNQLKQMYWGNASKASKAKAQLEIASASDYDKMIKQLNSQYGSSTSSSTPTPTNTPNTTSSNTGSSSTSSSYTVKSEYGWQWSASAPTVKDTSWDKGNSTYTYNDKSWYYESNWIGSWASTWATVDKWQQVRDYWNSLTAEQQQKAAAQDKMKTVMQQYWLTVKPSEWTSAWWTPEAIGWTKWWETPKQTEWDYQDNSQARMNQILNNLNGYRQTNPELFKNSDAFYNFFIKDKWRSQDQIDYLWEYYNNVQKYSKYDNMSSSSLWEWLADGSIPQDYLDYIKSIDYQKYQEILSYKQAWEDRIKNESYLEDLSSMAWFEWWESEPSSIQYGKRSWIWLDENGDWIDDRRYHAPTEEELQLSQEDSEYEAEKLKLKNAYKWLQNDLTEQYPDADLSTIMILTSDRGTKIQKALDTISVAQTKTQWRLAYLQNERATMDKAWADSIAQLQKNLWLYYQYSPQWIAELAQSQYWATNITLDQADSWNETQKQMALDAAITPIFEQYWDIIQRSPAQVINDVIACAKKNWMWLRQALEENFMKPLREKPAYKNIQAQLSSPTPETVKMWDEWYYWDATTQSWKPISWWGTSGYMYSSVDWSVWTWKSESRTERNNNPTAMTTDVAKSLWMVEWVDYVRWDSFKDKYWKTLYTAKLLGDPIQTTIDGFNAAASRWTPIFYTRDWAQRWTHTAMSNEEWLALSDEQKAWVIAQMLQREGGQMWDMAYYVENWIPTTKSEWWAWGTDWKVTPEDLADWNSGVDKLFEANVLSWIPIQLRNTNVEKEYYLSIIDELYKQWITDVFEASQMINWFVINNTSVKAVAAQKQVLDVLKATAWKWALPSEALQAIASDINNWNYSGAYKRLETVMGEFAYNTKIPSVQTYTPQWMWGAMTAISAIEEIAPLGWKTWKLEKYLKNTNLQSSIATEIGWNLTSLWEALVDMWFSEAAVYWWETNWGGKVEWLLPTIDDNREVFKQKLSNIENIIVRNTNQWREAYWLPKINKQQLFSGEYNSLYGLDKWLRRPYWTSSSSTTIQWESLFNVWQ